jgi:hypothetical protein
MVPRGKDFTDFVGNFRWFLYLGRRPRFDRWTYWEKFDYFAVFWGVAIIGFSGLVLWFPQFFTTFLPGWFLNAAHVVHSDEALLATGFIFIFHFFHTHLRPETFPLDPVIFTGRIPLVALQGGAAARVPAAGRRGPPRGGARRGADGAPDAHRPHLRLRRGDHRHPAGGRHPRRAAGQRSLSRVASTASGAAGDIVAAR